MNKFWSCLVCLLGIAKFGSAFYQSSLIKQNSDVCFNDDYDYTTNEIKTTVPISSEAIFELIEHLSASSKLLNS